MILIVNGVNTGKGGSGAHSLSTWLRSLDRFGKMYHTLDTIPAWPRIRGDVLRASLMAFYFLPGTLLRVFRLPLFELIYKTSPILLWKFLRAVRCYRPKHVIFSHHAIFYLSFFIRREGAHFIIQDLLYRRSRSLGFSRRLSKLVFMAECVLYRRAASLLCLSYQEERILRRFGLERIQMLSCFATDSQINPPANYDLRNIAIVSDWRRRENIHGLRTFFQQAPSIKTEAEDGLIDCKIYGFNSEGAGGMLSGLPGACTKFNADVRGFFKDHSDIPEGIFLIPIYQGAGIKLKLLDALKHRRYVFGTPGAFEGLPRHWLTEVSTVVRSLDDLAKVKIEVDSQSFARFEQKYSERFRELGELDFSSGSTKQAQQTFAPSPMNVPDSTSMQMNALAENPSTCFSIVSHGHGKLVGQLLASIIESRLIDPVRDQVIVTLNLPEDEGFLVEGSPLPMTVIRNKSPKGFGANHNAAFANCKTDLFCVLNPDLQLESLDLAYMRQVLADPSVGAWAPQVFSPAMTVEDSARKFPTPAILFRRIFLKQYSIDYVASNTPVEVDWVAGMFMAFRSNVFGAHNGFDESYHMYMEDVDICRRLHLASLKIIYDTRTAVVHDARRDSRRKLKYLIWHALSLSIYFRNARKVTR